MSSPTIKWNKTYHEDLGTIDQDGFYDYAYQYFLYSFYLPEKFKIVLRNYTYTNLEGSLFLYKDNKPVKESEVDIAFISAILAFMYTKQGIIHFSLFDGAYKPIDLAGLKDNSADFSFVRIEDKE